MEETIKESMEYYFISFRELELKLRNSKSWWPWSIVYRIWLRYRMSKCRNNMRKLDSSIFDFNRNVGSYADKLKSTE